MNIFLHSKNSIAIAAAFSLPLIAVSFFAGLFQAGVLDEPELPYTSTGQRIVGTLVSYNCDTEGYLLEVSTTHEAGGPVYRFKEHVLSEDGELVMCSLQSASLDQ